MFTAIGWLGSLADRYLPSSLRRRLIAEDIVHKTARSRCWKLSTKTRFRVRRRQRWKTIYVEGFGARDPQRNLPATVL